MATTDRLIAMVRSHRQGEEYPTVETLIGNLPTVLRALCDHVLTGQTTALDVAYRLASIIEAVEGGKNQPPLTKRTLALGDGPRDNLPGQRGGVC
ncbi:MAG TPA: hypothetical protein PK708_13570 [Candidatus Competibacter sp.]|jgi:DUF1680 family protein|nr:hypothetical protein [Candidatus Competibacter sp.]